MAVGWRYSLAGNAVYIIQLSAQEEETECGREPGYFFSDNCLCLSITNANTGEEQETIIASGEMHREIEYRKGAKIPGKCWYVHSYEDLFTTAPTGGDSLLSKAFDGTIYKGSILYRRFDRMIAEYESSVEEVAAEMNIAPRELQEKLDYLKKGQVNEKEIGKPILDAINRIYSRKVDNGELVPGYMKLFRERGLL